MNRRDFFKKAIIPTLSVAAGGLVSRCEEYDYLNHIKYNGNRLIIIRLDGGSDALYTFSPAKHDLLFKLRPKIYKSTSDKGISIYDWILHHKWKGFHELILRGDARIISNVGYPINAWTGSHFGSADIWESGQLPGDSSPKSGWIGRLLDRGALNQNVITWPVVNLDPRPRMFDQGLYHTGVNWMGTNSYSVIRKYAQQYYQHQSALTYNEDEYKTYLLHELLVNLQPAEGYTLSDLGSQFAHTESMINSEIPIAVIHMSQYGHDTHVGTDQTLPALHEDLVNNLYLFVKRLKNSTHWKQTQVFIYSEFGRTLDENADGGTDHGTAGHVFALGGIDLFNKAPFNSRPAFETFSFSGNHYLDYQIDLREILKIYEQLWLT